MALSAPARQDITDLANKIDAFRAGTLDEERFKHFRLTRGVYGQRQLGVHMFRTKIPGGRLSAKQLDALADASERFTNGRLHLTTRQNVQLHYVKLDDAVALSEQLAEAGVTAREACGNTVRNVTASASAGVDPDEPFDVAPYVDAVFEHFLRNPVSAAMGRKIKISFSSSEADTGLGFFHDFGFVPRVRIRSNGAAERGFKVYVGGGLGAQPIVAQVAHEFLPEQDLLPFTEAAIRVFDRHGERQSRMKARMKFLLKKIGLVTFLELVEAERGALAQQEVWVEHRAADEAVPALPVLAKADAQVGVDVGDANAYATWLETNVLPQKQAGFHRVNIALPLGNIDAERARALGELVRRYAADDIRLTVGQGFELRWVRPEALPALYVGLQALHLAAPGADSTADVTACPGTDTCNLGVTNSTGLAAELERVIRVEYPDLLRDTATRIKISGCMNACGQHMVAAIGLHGSSIKRGPLVVPAMQIVLGGGQTPTGEGLIAERVIKLPTRRAPAALRLLLDAYLDERIDEGEYFSSFYRRLGKKHFYALLKPLAQVDEITEDLLRDWGDAGAYVQAIGVGECAGVTIDLVGGIIADQRERLDDANSALVEGQVADAIYHAYSGFVTGAKALLLSAGTNCNTQAKILTDFDELFGAQRFPLGTEESPWHGTFEAHVLRMRTEVPTPAFAKTYLADAEAFYRNVLAERNEQLSATAAPDQAVITHYYSA